MPAETWVASGIVGTPSNITNDIARYDQDPDVDTTTFGTIGDDGSDAILILSFPSPSGNLAVGAGLQQFRMRVRKAQVSGGGDGTYVVVLFEGGAQVGGTLASGTIPADLVNGQVVTAFWDAAVLSAVSGANVEVRIWLVTSGGSPANRRCGEVGGVAWVADVAVAGTPHDRVVDDAAGVVDAAAAALALARAPVDPVGAVDMVAAVAVAVRDATDPVGVADSVTVDAGGGDTRTAIDAIGIADTTAVQGAGAITRTITDPAGVIDTTTRAATAARTATDSVPVADSVSRSLRRSLTDPVSVADTTARVATQRRTVTDAAAIADTVDVGAAGVITRTITDRIGAADTAVRVATSARTATEPIRVIDTRTGAVGVTRAITDPVATVDSAARTAVQVRSHADPVGTADSVGVAGTGIINRTVIDSVAISDAVEAAIRAIVVNARGSSSSPDGRGGTTPGSDARGRTLVGVNVH